MRNLNVHYFKDNKKLADYLTKLCDFFKMDINTIEVKDDMAVLEGKDAVMVFTKNEEIMLEFSENCNCIIFHHTPDLRILSQLMETNTHFTFVPRNRNRKA